MINLYSTLHTIVFPLIGKFLGLLGGIAMTPYKHVVDCFLGVTAGFSCVNIYTGANFIFSGLDLGVVGSVIVNTIIVPIFGIFTACCDLLFTVAPVPASQIPFGVAVICFSLTFGFVFGIVKWLLDIIF